MYISNNPSVVNGFKRWSVDHLERGENTGPAATNPIILTDPLVYGPNKPPVIPTGTGSV